MYNILSISRIFIYVMSIVLLVSSIKTKNKKVCKNNLITSIIFIIYFYLSLFVVPGYFEFDLGWEVLFYLFIAGIDTIILMTGIIINIVKIKRKEGEEKDNRFSKIYGIILVSIPLVMVIASYIYEINVLRKSDLVLTFNYQNGIVISEDTRVAISKDFCKKISISEKFKNKKANNLEYYTYDIEENENGELIITSEYDDPMLMEINTEIVKKIYKDESYTKNETALRLYEDESNAVYRGIITKIVGTDYYIVDYLISRDSNTGGGTGLGSAIFYGSTFIDDIDVSGSLDSVYSYSE